ncbi:MAG: PEP-CTERM sorting domain-containing protein [Burkholderiaceae bacterium]|nr:PEP-CTERM sorting domain-containing protein [Burkholderiaceae bacterium]
MTDRNERIKACPQCGGALARIRRLVEDRDASLAAPVRRYRCAGKDCGWEGLLVSRSANSGARRRASRRARHGSRSRCSRVGVALAAGLGFAFAATATVRIYQQLLPNPTLARIALHPVVPFGQSHDGSPISPRHPLLLKVSAPTGAGAAVAAHAPIAADGPVVPGAAIAADASVVAGPPLAPQSPDSPRPPDAAARAQAGTSPAPQALELRQNCAWGDPGRNPYKGTIEQALEGARLPPEVVQAMSARIRSGKVSDRLEITNEGIRGVHEPREYSARSIAMTFGRTLCMNTRVNFVPGHMERADLYEVADASGKNYSVMVPYVCGNVSVLSERAERDDEPLATTIDGRPLARKTTDLIAAIIPGGSSSNRTVTGNPGGGTTANTPEGQVPEPGTLLNIVAGASLMAWFIRRKRRRQDESASDRPVAGIAEASDEEQP